MLPFPAPAIVAPAPIGAVPQCPTGQTDGFHEVRTYAGAGGERRTYNCTCGMTWNQKRPDKLAPGEDPDVRQSNRAALGGAKRSGREYKCGHCGEPKKGHVCTVAGGDVNKRARTSPPPPAAASPALPPMRREQYDDMLKFSTPPTDGELLAFLRKHDLRPSEATDLYKSMQSYQKALNDGSMLATPEDVVAAMTQIAGEPEDAPTAHAIAMAEAGSARSAEEIVAAIGEHGEPASPAELSLDELLNFGHLDACADCGDEIVGDDRKTCNCGKTVVHRFCFKLCEHCGWVESSVVVGSRLPERSYKM
jgi:hypothetical protein